MHFKQDHFFQTLVVTVMNNLVCFIHAHVYEVRSSANSRLRLDTFETARLIKRADD